MEWAPFLPTLVRNTSELEAQAQQHDELKRRHACMICSSFRSRADRSEACSSRPGRVLVVLLSRQSCLRSWCSIHAPTPHTRPAPIHLGSNSTNNPSHGHLCFFASVRNTQPEASVAVRTAHALHCIALRYAASPDRPAEPVNPCANCCFQVVVSTAPNTHVRRTTPAGSEAPCV